MSQFVKLTLERMVRAFTAAALGTLAVGINTAGLNQPGLKALGVGAIASGVSACISIVSQLFGPDPNSTSFTNTTVTTPEAGGK